MGAHDYIITCKTEKKNEVTEIWEAQQEEDRYESGEGAYAGNSTTMWGSIRFMDKRFASENEARNYCLDQHEKREAPVAVSFYLSVEKGERDKKRLTKANEAYNKLWEKAGAIISKVNNALRARKSKMIGCSECGSKLSKTHFLAKPEVYEVIRNHHGDAHRSFGCSVCKSPLVSATMLKRVAVYEPKLAAAYEAQKEAQKPKAGKKIGWVVGGWAAS